MSHPTMTLPPAASVEELRQLSSAALLQLFKQLPAPAIAEMHGEYKATMLRQPNPLASLAGFALENPLLPWQCKAFRPVDAQQGRGYNTFLLAGRIIQQYPMLTMLAPSRYDGRPAYQLVYRQFHSLCADVHMVDEVRRVAAGLYLGIGTWRFSDRQRRMAYPFLLEGPVAEYRGDIGKLRTGFTVTAREVPAWAALK